MALVGSPWIVLPRETFLSLMNTRAVDAGNTLLPHQCGEHYGPLAPECRLRLRRGQANVPPLRFAVHTERPAREPVVPPVPRVGY